MGCGQSRGPRLLHADDSVHVMLSRDKKQQQQKGEKHEGYVARSAHPLLKPKAKAVVATIEGSDKSETINPESSDENIPQ
jgi:hypothetical protein